MEKGYTMTEMMQPMEGIPSLRLEAEKCNNCGWALSEENIRLALEDAGGDIPQEDLTFCCPSYSDERGCQGYSREDREKPAYWRTN